MQIEWQKDESGRFMIKDVEGEIISLVSSFIQCGIFPWEVLVSFLRKSLLCQPLLPILVINSYLWWNFHSVWCHSDFYFYKPKCSLGYSSLMLVLDEQGWQYWQHFLMPFFVNWWLPLGVPYGGGGGGFFPCLRGFGRMFSFSFPTCNLFFF